MGNRDKMPAPMALEDYAAQRIRDWAERPMDLSGLGKLRPLRDPDQIIISASTDFPVIDDDTIEMSVDHEAEVMARMPGIRSFSWKENGMQFNENADGSVTGQAVDGVSRQTSMGAGKRRQDIVEARFPKGSATRILGHSHNSGDPAGSFPGPLDYLAVEEQGVPNVIVHGSSVMVVEKVNGRFQTRILNAEGLSHQDRKLIQKQMDYFQSEVRRKRGSG